MHVDSLSFQHEHKEVFMTSYLRHAPVGGKQAGIQPECNQYRHSPDLLGGFFWFFFVQSRDLTTGSSAVAAQPISPFVPVSTRWDREAKKALIRTERRAEEVGGGSRPILQL